MNWDDRNADEKVQRFKGSKVFRIEVFTKNCDDRNTDNTDKRKTILSLRSRIRIRDGLASLRSALD